MVIFMPEKSEGSRQEQLLRGDQSGSESLMRNQFGAQWSRGLSCPGRTVDAQLEQGSVTTEDESHHRNHLTSIL
jgi:hypothetical protein